MRLPRIDRCPGCNPLRGATTSAAATNVGWAFGAGYQVALTRWLMLKAEYLYYDLGKLRRSGSQQISTVLRGPTITSLCRHLDCRASEDHGER